MARKPVSTSEETKKPAELTMPREEAEAKLQARITKGIELRRNDIRTLDELEVAQNEYSKWNSFNSDLLKRMFTTEELEKEYGWYSGGVMTTRSPSLSERAERLGKSIDEKAHRIESIIERLELFSVNSAVHVEPPQKAYSSSSYPPTRKVFVVHGHDEIAKANLEIFLGEIGLDPIVLHRQPDQGLTIIEKFEKHSDVGYAFILLTPDEIAYLKADADKPDDQRKKEFRARPNVVFEFGYFVGKLGRGRVCCLYTGDVSLPGDVSGMIYKAFSKNIEEIGYSIIKDLKAAGYEIS